MPDTHREMSTGEESKTACPHCKRLVPCGIVPKRGSKDDILDRIRDFQSRLWEKKQRDSLESIAEDIIKEVINLRIKAAGMPGRGAKHSGHVPPGVCPYCSNRIPYGALNPKNQRDILDRIKELQVRLKKKRSEDPAYAILEDAQLEIGRLRSSIDALSGRK